MSRPDTEYGGFMRPLLYDFVRLNCFNQQKTEVLPKYSQEHVYFAQKHLIFSVSTKKEVSVAGGSFKEISVNDLKSWYYGACGSAQVIVTDVFFSCVICWSVSFSMWHSGVSCELRMVSLQYQIV